MRLTSIRGPRECFHVLKKALHMRSLASVDIHLCDECCCKTRCAKFLIQQLPTKKLLACPENPAGFTPRPSLGVERSTIEQSFNALLPHLKRWSNLLMLLHQMIRYRWKSIIMSMWLKLYGLLVHANRSILWISVTKQIPPQSWTQTTLKQPFKLLASSPPRSFRALKNGVRLSCLPTHGLPHWRWRISRKLSPSGLCLVTGL